MIKLYKGPEPQILAQNSAAWERVLIDHDAAGTKPRDVDLNRYNNKDTKDALLLETFEKCAYCESKFKHIAPGDIEHIVPKKLGHQFRFKWENLTIACTTCNKNKGIRQNLVDPYVDDPSAEFHLCGPAILPEPSSGKAIASEAALDLNRKELLDRRTERLKNLHRMLIIAQQQANPDDREVLLDELRIKEVRDGAEFAAMARAYVSDLIARGLIAPPSQQ